MDKAGHTIDFFLMEPRDEQAVRRFLTHTIGRHSLPETITIDGSEANAAVIRSDHDEHGTSSTIRRVKYLNNIVEQDHRAVKRIICLIKEGTEGLTPAEQFYALAPNPQPNRAFSLRLSSHLGNDASAKKERRPSMALYLLQVAYTSEAWAIQLQNPLDRREAVSPVVERLGGYIERAYYAFGDYDAILIIEMPDHVSAAAFSLAVSAGRAVKAIKTSPLLTIEDGIAAMQQAASAGYRPPGG
jgi:uncharacterized protein with GYD domain